jgi:hypothetical protein
LGASSSRKLVTQLSFFFCCCLLSKTKPKTNGTHFRHQTPNSSLCVCILPLSLIVTISLIH